MIILFDSITVSAIPQDAEAVAGYTSGFWPTYNELVAKYPHAHVLSIAVTALHRARCLDVEPGDASPAQAPGWYRNLAERSQGLPVLYCSASTVAQLVSTMSHSGIDRDQYYIWSAHYTFREHICSASVCGYPKADATQWTDKALGRNLDQSLCHDYFFGAKPAPAPAPPKDTVDLDVGTMPDGRQEIFVQLKSGEIQHRWNAKDGGWVPDWHSLGSPGK